jgi:hypothetical protein
MRQNQVNRKNRRSREISRASFVAMEEMENRVLLSSTLATWNFNNVAIGTSLSPAPSAGTGTALTVGFQSSSSNANSPGGTYAYPNAAASGTGDISDILVGSGNNPGVPTDASSEGVGANAWRVRGNGDGWSDNAAIGSQGAQFSTSTVGFSNVVLTFDLDPSSKSAAAEFEVEYTTNGTTWTNATSLTVGTVGGGANQGASDGMSILTNSTNTNIVNGSYFVFNNNADGLFWQNNIQVNLGSISGVNNNPNFGVRIVNAATGNAEFEQGGTAFPAAGAGNWRIDDVRITAGGAAPAVTSSPSNQVVVSGNSASFTATASGSPTPGVQWWSEAPGAGSFSMDTTDPGNNTDTLTITSATSGQSGTQYEAVFSSAAGSVTSSAATLTVATAPVITADPASQLAPAGSTVTLVSTAVGLPTMNVQWWASSGGAFSLLNNSSTVSGATTPVLTLSTTEGITGDKYEAIYTNGSGTATTTAATVTVQGTPITQWDFTSGESASPGGDSDPGTGNSPLPTSEVNTTNNAITVEGMNNEYDGLPSFPEADIIPLASSTDPGFTEYVMRIRGGGGEGPTGTPGNPDGWSQNAPTGTQGVQFDVNTVGYSNITLNFDWTQGAIGDMQAQYFNGSSWVSIAAPVQAVGGDYYGVTDPTTTTGVVALTADTSASVGVASVTGFYYGQNITVGGIGAVVTGVGSTTLTIVPNAAGSVAQNATVTAAPNPTGVSVNLQGITFANDNPDLKVRLVSVYDGANSNLPNIIDGNPAVNGGIGSHGQYASGFGLDSDIQVIDLDSYVNSNGSTENADGSNFTLTLNGHTTGTITYSATPATMAANIQAALVLLPNIGNGNVTVASTIATNTYTPPGPITAYNGFSVIFGGALKDTVEPTMTISDSNDNVSTWQIATPATLTTTTNNPYTVTANQSLVLSVGSTTGFTSGNPITLGTITCLITNVGSGTITVTPESSGSVLAGTTVTQLGATGFVDGGGNWELGNITFNGDLTSGNPSIVSSPASETVAGGFAASFTATAYSETLPTVTWQVNNGTSWVNVGSGTVTPTGGTFTASSNNSYTSTYTFTTDSNLDQNGFQYRAVFSNGNGNTDTSAATLTVVSPVTPYVLIQPTNQSVEEGENTQFTTYAIGNPSPTVQWQLSTNGGSSWTNLVDDDVTVTGSQTDTLTIATADDTNQNGDLYRAVFSSAAGVTDSNAATLSVLPTDGILTDWDFNALDPTVNSSGGSADPYINSPAPVTAGVDNSLDVGGTATALGMTLPYNPADPATGTAAPGAVNADDVTNSGPAVVDNFSENTWRIRAGINSTSGGAPANGWSNFVSQYTQGAQFSVPTTGYSNIYVTLDWFSTHSGEQNAQEQYTLDGTTWTNVPASQGGYLSLYAPGNDDFYGDSALGGVVPVVFNLTGIAGANNDPNFGVRLVNAYNVILSNQQSITLNSTDSFKLTFNSNTTGSIAYSANQNTEIANITAALNSLTGVGANNFSVTYNSTTASYVIQLQGSLGTAIQNPMTISDASGKDTLTQSDQYANAQLNLDGDPFTAVAYNGSKGNWRLDNIVFHGTDGVEPTIVSTQVGTGAAQRSTVGSISVTFNAPVVLGSGAFTLYQEVLNSNGTINTAATPINVTPDVTASQSGDVLTLSVTPGGPLDRTGGDDAGFFTNGIYQLVLDGTTITDAATASVDTGGIGTAELNNGLLGPVTFASAETGTGSSNYFHVLFGDLAGTGIVNLSDERTFARDYLSTTGESTYNAALDYDGIGIINLASERKFAADYLSSFTY